jgi:SAM-dependent methyltransferase
MRPPPALRFAEPAALYDLCHQWIDHRAVLSPVVEALRRHGLPDDGRALEACCGTGLWLAALPAGLQKLGFDLDEPSLAVARARLPGAALFCADLGGWALPADAGGEVDVAIAIFGALAYLDDQALPGGVACLRAALKPGGLLVAEPWVAPEELSAGRPELLTVDTPHLKLSRHVLPERVRDPVRGDQVVLRFHHLLSATGLSPRLITTEDRLTLRRAAALHDALRHGGFSLLEELPGTGPDRQIGLWRRSP